MVGFEQTIGLLYTAVIPQTYMTWRNIQSLNRGRVIGNQSSKLYSLQSCHALCKSHAYRNQSIKAALHSQKLYEEYPPGPGQRSLAYVRPSR